MLFNLHQLRGYNPYHNRGCYLSSSFLLGIYRLIAHHDGDDVKARPIKPTFT